MYEENKIVCITLYNGNQIIGRYRQYTFDVEGNLKTFTINYPKPVFISQDKAGNTNMGLGDMIGKPKGNLTLKGQDIFNTYEVDDIGLLDLYYKSTSGLTLAPLNFNPKKEMN